MHYIIDDFYEFEVDYSIDNPDYFYLKASYNDCTTNIPLKKFPFQKRPPYDRPATITCRVKTIDANGLPVLAPSIASYVKLLYQKKFARGESFECTVISAPENPATAPYIIEDKYGIIYKVYEPEATMSKGQRVNYKFTRLTDRYFIIQQIQEDSRIKFFTPEDLLKAANIRTTVSELMLRIFYTAPQLESARKDFEAAHPSWIITALKSVIATLPEWFLRTNLAKTNRVYMQMLDAVRNIVLYLLEGSSFLSASSPEHRRVIQSLLTDIADSLEPYEIMLNLLRDNGEDAYVRNLLDKLQESGYLYHPARQFAVLMLIFRRHPDKVEYYLSRIFESIFGRDLENWNREPFKSAFIEQFQIYVRETRTAIDTYPVAESREQKAGIENIILAIAMQILLNPADPNRSQQWALFYRYVSLLRPLQSEELLTKAFMTLMGAELPTHFSYGDLKQPMMMITHATVMPGDNILNTLTTTHRYTNNGVDITISPDGLTLRPTARPDITERAIPAGIMPWLMPQIFINGVRGLSGSRLRKINDHNSWWHDIEVNLFEQGLSHTEKKEEIIKTKATVGCQVFIVIDSFSNIITKNPIFHCRISDLEYDEGRGILKRENIVAYGVRQISMRSFYSGNRNQRGFLATVINIDDDDNYEFSLLDEVNRYAVDNLNYDDEYRAIITISNDRTYAAISDTGVGLLLERNPNYELTNGSIVKFKFSNIATEGQRIGYITGVDDSDNTFDQSDAFAHLIDNIAVDDEIESSNDNDEILRDPEDMLSKEDIRETIEIIRFKAIAETDLIKAYDYLRLARLLAMAIDLTDLADKLLAHATMLSYHQFFATNSRLDAEKLEDIHDLAVADPFLRMIYHRLELVSWLGQPDKTSLLYDSIHNPTNNLECDIARMVMAYNLIHSAGGNNSITNDIKQKIMEKLNVNNETRKGKYYGSESKYLEFKTSFIYRPGLPGEEIKEDPQGQQFHILSRIAGLLNANGGRLYLGVNNDGFEVGLHDDFKYLERHSVYAGNYEFKRVNTLEKIAIFLEELINQNFERKIGRKIAVSIDDEAEKGVIVFNVEQSLEPVFLNGRLFVRQSGQATREYRGTDIDDFVNERSALLMERRRILDIENEDKNLSKQLDTSAQETAPAKIISSGTVKKTLQQPTLLRTCNWRTNIRHSYEPSYVEPYGYLYFRDDNTLMYSRDDKYTEPGQDGCTLALAIPQDLSDGVLILGYQNEKVLKIALSEIVRNCDNRYSKFNEELPLIFAALARSGDGLVCIAADNGNTMSKRMVPVCDIPFSRLNNSPKRIHESVMNHTVFYEIADETSLSNFNDCSCDKMPSRRFGVTIRCADTSPDATYKLSLITNDSAPIQ